MARSLMVAAWLVTDTSFTTKGPDPTFVARYELVNVYGRELVVTEFFGDHYLEFDADKKYGPFSANQLDSWLETLGAPTMDWVYDALTQLEEQEAKDNDANPYYEADQRLMRYMN